MKYEIEKGDVFTCIKTFKMEDGEKSYIKGKEYKSEKEDCLTDEQGFIEHYMNDLPYFFEHFKIR